MRNGPYKKVFGRNARDRRTRYVTSQVGGYTKPVSLERALEIFDQLADRKDIAFGHSEDGCYERAHLMCSAIREMGLTAQKAWAFEEWYGSLYVETPDNKVISWQYHVAPSLSVRMPDGRLQHMVLDPGLFDGPATLQEWADVINADKKKVQILPVGIDHPEYKRQTSTNTKHRSWSRPDRQANKVMKEFLELQGPAPRRVFPTGARRQVSAAKAKPQPQQGKTWVTVPSMASGR